MRATLQSSVSGRSPHLPAHQRGPASLRLPGRPTTLTVVYSYGQGEHMDTVLSDSPNPVVHIAPEANEAGAPLVIRRARYGLIPQSGIGWAVAGCLAFSSCAMPSGRVSWSGSCSRS